MLSLIFSLIFEGLIGERRARGFPITYSLLPITHRP